MGSPLLTTEQAQFVKQHVVNLSNAAIAALVNETYDLDLIAQQLKTWKKNHGAPSNLTGRFEPGQPAINKGKHYTPHGGTLKTMFKKGQRPHNYDPVGTEKVKCDNYVWVKITDTGKYRWKQKQRLIYEQLHGPIPKGNHILFADGNNRNFDPNNLVMVTKAEQLELVRRNHIYTNSDMTKTMLNVAKVQIKLSNAKGSLNHA